MQRPMTILIAVLALALFATDALSGKSSNMRLSEKNKLYTHITEKKPYTDWKMWPGKDALYKGQQPHGALLTTYVNDTAYRALQERPGQMPDGAIIVKENYTPDKDLAAVTVMYKEEGFDPHHNDWYYLKYAPDGTIDAQGAVVSCMDCHAKAKGNDWLFTGRIGK